MCIYIYIYIYIVIYIYSYIYSNIYIVIYIYSNIIIICYMCIYIYIYVYRHIKTVMMHRLYMNRIDSYCNPWRFGRKSASTRPHRSQGKGQLHAWRCGELTSLICIIYYDIYILDISL